MKIFNNTGNNPILSITPENFAFNSASVNGGPTCVEYINMYNFQYLAQTDITVSDLIGVYDIDGLTPTMESLCSKFLKLREMQTSFPIEYIDLYLTNLVNTYLNLLFKVDVDIDSVFLDFEELMEYLSEDKSFEVCTDKLANKLFDILELNHHMVDTVTSKINNNIQTLNGKNMYILPILYREGVICIKPGKSLPFNEFLKLTKYVKDVPTKKHEVIKDSVFNSFLEHAENVSDPFKKHGYIKCCFNNSDNIKGYESFYVFKDLNNNYILQF